MSGWTSNLAHGLAEHLAASGVGTYRPTGIYDDTETGIVVGKAPASPPRIVALTPYPLSDSPDADSVTGLQVRARSAGPDPRDALDLIDAVFAALAGLTSTTFAGAFVHRVQRTGGGDIGTDDNGRYEHTSTYQLTAHHPTTHRP